MNAIEAHNLGKRYRIRGMAPPTLFGSVRRLVTRTKPEDFWALRDVDFEIQKGKTIGVVGPNGSGKSSLLGLVAGTITPTEGVVKTDGRISSLLELGAGFHPDLTGRENVYLNASILGIPRHDVDKRFDHIVDFSGLHEFIDMPVKHYSSGMYVRLGFSVAVEMNPDVLLIDEVLAVGDIQFQMKCLDRIREFQRKGKTLLFVSHALQTVEEYCDEALLIYDGRLVTRGDPHDVIAQYLKSYMGEGGTVTTHEYGTRQVELRDVVFRNKAGEDVSTVLSGEPMYIDIGYYAKQRVEKPVFGFSLKTGNGLYVFGSNTQIAQHDIPYIEGEGSVRLTIDPLTFLEGNYYLSLAIHSWDHAEQFHRREDWYPFVVKNTTEEQGLFHVHTAWSDS